MRFCALLLTFDSQGREDSEIIKYTNVMRKIIHHLMATGRGTRDLCGSKGLTTEDFVDAVSL